MSHDRLAFTPAAQLASLIRSRQLSPVELVDVLLSRIDELNPRLSAYITVTAEEARAAARRAEKAVMEGASLPSLHGVPVSIKDLFFTKGVRTTGGSMAYANFVPDEDAAVVERLKAAGAIILGKTNTPEFAMSSTTDGRLGGSCRNPWDTTRTSGGSSGGAASSVAAGMGPLAVGSDSGGSIRIPSAFCGVFGFKPTYGRVPISGGFDGMPLFTHVGPITRTVADAALMLGVMAGYDRRDPTSLRETPPDFLAGMPKGPGELRIAWSPDLGYATIDPEVREIAGRAAKVFDSLGFGVADQSPDAGFPSAAFNTIIQADLYVAFGHLLDQQADELVPYTRSTFERGRDVPAHEYSRAIANLAPFRARMADFFERYDLLLAPATAVAAHPLGQRPREVAGVKVSSYWWAVPMTMPFNITGQPAASLPCGFTAAGLPVGLQVIGRIGADMTVLQACAAFEAARPWADRIPAI
ncbi:MAG: amidase [Firmicutes bacterium]|nr:amidase [Bacillota bacterium]